ncbi:cupin domain-containing protein [Roseovarius sp. MMSF_3281]|uniref:cupin domain-containing protein n=1 Tax=Roseovarius sp. MMSF_3281 TaxID=3046694 RepID=UPI00273DA623|nr:cupin domain-containing protein [Roseovarius sp. MMSF_3281]
MIGERIKSIRRIRNMTLKELAKQANISEGHMSKIENDKTQPSVALLHRITQALDITIGLLFDETNGDEHVVSRMGQRPIIDLDPVRRGTGICLERIIPHSKDHILQCNIHIIEPNGSSEDHIQHVGEEMGYVLEGELELILDDTVYHLCENDSFHFNSSRKHAYRNPGKTRARVLWANTPPTF